MATSAKPKPLHTQLLEQARHLAEKDKAGFPPQASLRRAVSTAYYALFHLLIHEATRRLAKGRENKKLRLLLARAFEHSEIKQACQPFAGGTLPRAIVEVYGPSPVPSDLSVVAKAFLELQQKRHDADYAIHVRHSRTQSIAEVDRAQAAFEAWSRVRNDPMTNLFLTYLLACKKLANR